MRTKVEKLTDMLAERDARVEYLEAELLARERALVRYREALEELAKDSEVARAALGEVPE